MDYRRLEHRIRMSTIKYRDDPAVWEDYLSLCREALDAGMKEAHDWNHGVLRHGVIEGLRKSAQAHDFDKAERFDQLLYKSLLFGARDFFDDYLQAVEYGKPHDKKFYAPRRHYLLRYVRAYQKVLDGELDFLSISMPKRAGKSQMGINFINMLSGRNPDRSTLAEGTGDALVNSFYQGCLEYLVQPSDYHYYDIFPDAKLVQTKKK